MYSFKSKIRYSETDSRGRLSLEALLDYFQDCSAFQSEALGVGFYPLQERGLAWVLSYWQIVVDRFPDFYEDVETGTYPYNFKGCFGQRNFFMKDKDGNFLAKELAPSNIQVNAIAPGMIDTAMNHVLSEEDISSIIEEIPADRMGTPEEVAHLVWQVVNSPSYMTGQIISLDGGWI